MQTIRVGIIGLGANTRLRHLPGLRACAGVEIVGVCNRSPASTTAAAREHGIPRTFGDWRSLVADPGIDAVVIGTWPDHHAPATLAALDAGKHVLTEARMAASLEEARSMREAARRRPNLIAQIVPSPLGLRTDRTMKRLIASGFLGELREVVAIGVNDAYADPQSPRHWRQVAAHSGVNMLTLGILHETLVRWIPDPVRVVAQAQTFTPRRFDRETGRPEPVETPDSVHVLAEFPGGARGVYHLSGAILHGPGSQIHLYGSEGTLRHHFLPEDRLLGARRGDSALSEIDVPADEAGAWQVEADFIAAIRGDRPVGFTDFDAGVRYMEFTDAVARSLRTGGPVELA